MISKAKFFNMFKNIETNELSEEFKETLFECSNPQFVCIYGHARIGKSTKMNQIINGILIDDYFELNKPFETGDDNSKTVTSGCNVYGPVKLDELAQRNGINGNNYKKCELFFVDSEGLNALDGKNTKNCVCGILSLMQLCTITLSFLENGSNDTVIEANKCSSLGEIFDLNIGKGISKNRKKSVVFVQLDVNGVDSNDNKIKPNKITTEQLNNSVDKNK